MQPVAEFEEKLNSILGDRQAMGQIMALARSLSGEQPAGGQEGPGEAEAAPKEGGGEQSQDLSALLEQLDPRMLQVGMDVLRQMNSTQDRSAALLEALRPFLREERRPKLDRAIQIARMARAVRAALGALNGRGAQGVV